MDRLQGKLLDYLNLNTDHFVTSGDLSSACEVSSRTIKRRIQLLDDEIKPYGAHIYSSQQGYCLRMSDRASFMKYISQLKYQREVLSIDESDVLQIVQELLLSKYRTQDELAASLFISRSTIGKLMNDVREALSKFSIAVNQRPHYGYYLVGKEQVIRSYMVKFFFRESVDREIQAGFLNHLLGRQDDFIDEVYDIIVHYQIFRFENLMHEFISFLLISIFRNQQGIFIETSIPIWEEYSHEKETFICKLFEIIHDRFAVSFSHGDRNYLLSLMNSEGKHEPNNANDEFFDTVVDRFLEEIESVYGENFHHDEILRRGLIQHLHASYSRLYINAMVTNPLISMIKSSYIESYNYAILCGEIMKREFHISMSEDDIGYIALHFAAMKERMNLGKCFNAILVCGSGVGTAELLRVRLSSEIPALKVKQVCSSNELMFPIPEDISIIISTVPLEISKLSKPYIQVSSLIQPAEIDRIKDYLKNYQNAHEVKEAFTASLFFPQKSFDSKEEILEFVTKTLLRLKRVSENEAQRMLEREEASSTEINELVALPHCIVESHRENTFMIITLKRPILWGRMPVQFIVVAVIAKGTQINRVIFPLLYRVTSDKQRITKLMKIVEFHAFINLLFSDIPFDYQ